MITTVQVFINHHHTCHKLLNRHHLSLFNFLCNKEERKKKRRRRNEKRLNEFHSFECHFHIGLWLHRITLTQCIEIFQKIHLYIHKHYTPTFYLTSVYVYTIKCYITRALVASSTYTYTYIERLLTYASLIQQSRLV
jgi:hypothetical protein